MKYILGIKKGMTQRFLPDGRAVAVTVIEATPCQVTQVKTVEKDGYVAVQVGTDERKKLSKPEAGHVKGLKNFATLQEFPQKPQPLGRGDMLNVAQFAAEDPVEVTGISKGKGFQGVVKRHGFHGSPATHGHKDQLRMPGSIGAGGPQRVFKGTRMAGHMGFEQVTIKHAKIIEVLPEENLLLISGAVPGPNGAYVSVFSKAETEGTKAATPDVVAEAAKPTQGEKAPEVKATKE